MEILALLIIIYALKHAITDTKSAAAKSRQAYMASADKRFPDMPKGKRAAHAARHDLGWGLSQLGHGFPATRHGFMTGWHQSREAHHQAMLGRQEAKTAHLETKAGAVGQLQEYRARQQAALEQIRSGKQPGTPVDYDTGGDCLYCGALDGDQCKPACPYGSMDWKTVNRLSRGRRRSARMRKRGVLVTDTCPTCGALDGRPHLGGCQYAEGKEGTPAEPEEEGTPGGTYSQQFPVMLTATSKSGRTLNPFSGSPTDRIAVYDEDDLRRRLTAADQDPDIDVKVEPMPSMDLPGEPEAPASPGDTDVTEDHWGDPLPGGEGSASPEEGTPEGKEGSPEGTSPATGAGGEPDDYLRVPCPDCGSPVGTPCPPSCHYDPAAQDTSPTSTASTEGTTMAGDTSYNEIDTGLTDDHSTAEAAAAEHQQGAAQQEQAANAARTALAKTNAMIDAASALKLDSSTVSELMEHAEAQKDASEKSDAAHEALMAAVAAHQRVQETSVGSQTTLRTNHGQYQQAHDDSPVDSADSEFYAA